MALWSKLGPNGNYTTPANVVTWQHSPVTDMLAPARDNLPEQANYATAFAIGASHWQIGEELGALYKSFGDVLKQRFKGWTAYILSGNKELTKQIGLRSSRRTPLYNGSLPCTLLKYELY